MKFIFRNLPDEIISSILLYDEHFIMRNGKIISIIPKSDYRYTLLNFITFKLDFVTFYNGMVRYKYYFPNLYNYEERRINNSDLIQITINENHRDILFYSIWIGRQYPKSFLCNKKQNYFIENSEEYQWIYTEYDYIRR
jgi:hypothetical protein